MLPAFPLKFLQGLKLFLISNIAQYPLQSPIIILLLLLYLTFSILLILYLETFLFKLGFGLALKSYNLISP